MRWGLNRENRGGMAFFQKFLDWIKSLFWKEEMELTLVGLQNSGKTTFVNVIAVSSRTSRRYSLSGPWAQPLALGYRRGLRCGGLTERQQVSWGGCVRCADAFSHSNVFASEHSRIWLDRLISGWGVAPTSAMLMSTHSGGAAARYPPRPISHHT